MLSARTRYDIRTARTGRSQVMLIQFCGYQLLGIFYLLHTMQRCRYEYVIGEGIRLDNLSLILHLRCLILLTSNRLAANTKMGNIVLHSFIYSVLKE